MCRLAPRFGGDYGSPNVGTGRSTDQPSGTQGVQMTTSTEVLAKCALGLHPRVAHVNDHGEHYEFCLACGAKND